MTQVNGHQAPRAGEAAATGAPTGGRGRGGWGTAGFSVSLFALLLGLGFLVVALLLAGFAMVTGAPLNIQLSAMRTMAIVGLPGTAPFALAGTVLSIVGLRGAARGLPIPGLIMGLVCVVALVCSLPLLAVEPCFTMDCAVY